MRTKKRKFTKRTLHPSVVALLAGASLLGSTAMAEVLPFSVSASNTTTPDQRTLSFLQFNSALGTLTGVSFTLNSRSAGVDSTVDGSFSGGEGGSASALTQAVFDIDGPGSLQLFLGNGTATSSCSIGFDFGCDDLTGTPTPPVFSPLTVPLNDPPDDLTPFIGNGSSFFDVFVELSVSANVNSCTTNIGTPTCSATGSASWDGTVDVKYEYTPFSSVPEPATLALLGLGLAGLGYSRRKS